MIADALAPYLDAGSQGPAVSMPIDEPEPEPEADEPIVLDATSEPVSVPQPAFEVVAPRVPTAISDLAPVSDDLLPRRR